MWKEGYLALDLVKLINKLVSSLGLKKEIEYKLYSEVGRLKMKVLDGLHSQLQFLAFFSKINGFNP